MFIILSGFTEQRASFHKGSTKLSSAWLLSRPKCQARIHCHAAEKEKGRTQFIAHGSQMREKQNKIEFFSPGKEVVWQISKLRTVSFQFISKGASLARNKDALIVGANTEWADSRDGKWAVIMSICLLQFPPHLFVSLYISSSFFPSISSCLILLYHSVILLYIFFTSTFLCFHLFKKKKVLHFLLSLPFSPFLLPFNFPCFSCSNHLLLVRFL